MKARKGAWFVKVRGSYLPATPQGWLMHGFLLAAGVSVLYIAHQDTRPWLVMVVSMALQLIGLGAVFTWAASRKS